MAAIGSTTAEITNPKVINHQSAPAPKPKYGGNIRLPAPKKLAKIANPIMKDTLVVFILIGHFGHSYKDKIHFLKVKDSTI